jgi:hypothetical protein
MSEACAGKQSAVPCVAEDRGDSKPLVFQPWRDTSLADPCVSGTHSVLRIRVSWFPGVSLGGCSIAASTERNCVACRSFRADRLAVWPEGKSALVVATVLLRQLHRSSARSAYRRLPMGPIVQVRD